MADLLSIFFVDQKPVTVSRIETKEEKLDAAGFVEQKARDVFGINKFPEISDKVISIDVTTTEVYKHELKLTQNSISSRLKDASDNQNSTRAFTDHATRVPDEFTITGIISDVPVVSGLLGSFATTAQDIQQKVKHEDNRSVAAYTQFKNLIDAPIPVVLQTGLTLIKDVMLVSFIPTRTARSEGSLEFQLKFQKVIFSDVVIGIDEGQAPVSEVKPKNKPDEAKTKAPKKKPVKKPGPPDAIKDGVKPDSPLISLQKGEVLKSFKDMGQQIIDFFSTPTAKPK